MSNQLNGWKVLSHTRYSAVIANRFGRVYYGVNEPAKPRPGQGPLTVFKSKKSAEAFRSPINLNWNFAGSEWNKLVSCKYTPVEECHDTVWYRTSTETIVVREASQLPRGTILASEVTCLE